MQTETAQDLLEAVGITQKTHPNLYAACCHQCNSIDLELTDAGYPSFHCQCGAWQFVEEAVFKPNFPALGTPELDGILLVAGQKWLQDAAHSGKRDVAKNLHYDSFEQDSGGWISGRLGLLFQSEFPGHALARAIAQVNHA